MQWQEFHLPPSPERAAAHNIAVIAERIS